MDNELSHLVGQLRKVDHFRSLSPTDLLAIVISGQVKKYEKGAVIFQEADECAGMLVLLDGQVDLCKNGPEGQVTIINTLKPVIMFNEVAVLDGGPNPTSAIATENSLIWRVLCDRFKLLLNRYPQIATGLLNVLARRNRMIISQYGDLSFCSVNARISKQIMIISEEGKKPIFRAHFSIRKIASQAVTTPEAVSRALKLLQEKKIIEVDRKQILILDSDQLEKMSQISM